MACHLRFDGPGVDPGHISWISWVYCYDTRLGRNVTGVDEREWLSERFEERRSRLRAVAFRMLGSVSEADDAVQDAWLRLESADISAVDNLDAWLTTVVARVCLNLLRSRRKRREEPLDSDDARRDPGQHRRRAPCALPA